MTQAITPNGIVWLNPAHIVTFSRDKARVSVQCVGDENGHSFVFMSEQEAAEFIELIKRSI